MTPPVITPGKFSFGMPACATWPAPNDPDLTDPWAAVVAWQAGRCARCGGSDRLEKDHNHRTGLRRGLLCKGCNIHEGSCGDAACACAAYLSRPPTAILGVTVEHRNWYEVTAARFTEIYAMLDSEEAAQRAAQ